MLCNCKESSQNDHSQPLWWVSSAEEELPGTTKKTSYPHADSVYRSHPQDPTQRSWSVFDSSLVVPEYLVEFEYSFKSTEPREPDPVLPIQASAKFSRLTAMASGNGENLPNNERGLNGCWHLAIPGIETASVPSPSSHDSCTFECCTTPRPHSQGGKGVTLSNEYLQGRNGLMDFSHLSYLNLHNSNITGIEVLQGMPSLKVLVVSFNKILKITGLNELCLLEKLDLSYNLLKRIEGLSGLTNLLTLDLAGNDICCPDDLGLLQLQV